MQINSKILDSTSQEWIGLNESKHTLRQVFETQKSLDFVKNLTLSFHLKLCETLTNRKLNWFARTHIFGISYFCNEQKTFLWISINKNFISVKYFTGNTNIEGLRKANWVTGDDYMGSETLRITDDLSLMQAVKFALKAYKIAVEWNHLA